MSKLHEPSGSRSADGLYRQHGTTKEPRNEPCRRRFESIRPICMVDLSIINLSDLGLKLDQVTSLSFLLTSKQLHKLDVAYFAGQTGRLSGR